jgi:hypothetical protein
MSEERSKHRKAYNRYMAVPLPILEREMKEMYHKRFVEHDIECTELYRLASMAYNRRTRSGTGLIFHMNKFVGR